MAKITGKNLESNLEFTSNPRYTSDPLVDNDLSRKKYVDDQDALLIPLTQKAAALGVATLDGGGKIPASQLPNSVMEYQGSWSAATNTPTLADGVGNAGDVYKSTTVGSVDFGSGSIDFAIGDWAIYSGTIWEKSTNSDAVTSVAGKTGDVVLDTDDVSEGSNLYFTDSRAKAAAVSDAIVDAVTTVAPSQNAVFDALALKTTVTDLASVDNAKGASLVGVEDSAEKFTGTTVEAVLAELQDNIDNVAGSAQGREVKTLAALDISNGYLDLAQEALVNSVQVHPVGGILQEPGVDFTESVVSLKTRITFAGDMLDLVEGEKVVFYYEY